VRKQGLLLINLGSPDSPNEPDVRRYLREFLMDGRVIDLPHPLRWLLVNCRIVPKRATQSAHAYRSIWSPKGSPLIATGRSLAVKLEAVLGIPVGLAMRYQHPTVNFALRRLFGTGVRELTILPLFPQYAMSSYATAAAHVDQQVQAFIPGMPRRFIPPFFEEPQYLDALSATALPFLAHGFDHLLFSFHGLPERHLRKSDPTGGHCLASEHCCDLLSPARRTCYRAQCLATAQGVARRLELSSAQWSVSFQSRLGREPWMQPYTDRTMAHLGASGVKRLLVMCPAFVADCLETLEEIAIRGRETFCSAGGGELNLIPCLNDHPAWIDALASIVSRQLNQAECVIPQS
jgi:ferrochelatase